MSVCNLCLRAKTLPLCLQQLIVGNIALLATNVYLFINDITTGGVAAIPVTTGAAGEITVDVSQVGFFENHTYELWVTDAGAGFKDKQTITVGSDTTETICMRFEKVKDEDGENFSFLTQTITKDE